MVIATHLVTIAVLQEQLVVTYMMTTLILLVTTVVLQEFPLM
jgi:hypothetical protein